MARLEGEQQRSAQPAGDTAVLYDAPLLHPKGNLTFNRCSAFWVVSWKEKEFEETHYKKVL